MPARAKVKDKIRGQNHAYVTPAHDLRNVSTKCEHCSCNVSE